MPGKMPPIRFDPDKVREWLAEPPRGIKHQGPPHPFQTDLAAMKKEHQQK